MESLRNHCRGKDSNFLLAYYCAGIAGRFVSPELLFSEAERDWLFGELSRRAEAQTAYAHGERRTWRRDHLSPQELAGIRRPRVDEFVFERLRERGLLPVAGASRWPDGRRFALCITHDVDHVSWHNPGEMWRRWLRQRSVPTFLPGQGERLRLTRVLRSTAASIVRRHVLRVPDRLAGIAEWMKIEDGYGFRSTFYFFAGGIGDWHPFDLNYSFSDKVPFAGKLVRVREIMRELEQSGWEVGLHPSLHAAACAEWLRLQKEKCEQACGAQVVSVRQHYLQYDVSLTPALQSEVGLQSDSTQGFNDLIGFRAGACFPYLCWDHKRNATLPLLELPLHIQDGPLMRASVSVDDAIESTLGLMDRAEELGGCLVILWHPIWLASDNGIAVFRAVLEEGKRRNAWGCSARQLAGWWTARVEAAISTLPQPAHSQP